MRIIGGNFKGKKILLPEDKYTRPLRDMVKESIFNLIEHSNKMSINISNSNILDLFSGSGSFGLECVSRGAENVIFIENYIKAVNTLKKNISLLKASKSCEIIQQDCFKFFENSKVFNINFDIIFIDPPYKEIKINLLLEKIRKNKILKKDGIIILHRHKKDCVVIDEKFQIIDQRIYGISKIILGN